MGNTYVPVKGTHVLFCANEVTLDNYETFLRLTEKRSLEPPHFEQSPDHPVVGVNFQDAQAFCRWLTGVERASGRIGPDQEYRLPTANEWSKAVGLLGDATDRNSLEQGLRSKTMYPWGDTWPPAENAGNYAAQEIDHFNDGHEFTAPVASYAPNEFGIYDLGGNVWEWCESSGKTDLGQGILRGGSWVYFLKECLLASYEYRVPKQLRASSFGFRCVFDDRADSEGEAKERAPVDLATTTEEGQARFLGKRSGAPETPEEAEKRLAEQFEARKRFLMSADGDQEDVAAVSDARARLLSKGEEPIPVAGEEGAAEETRERERPDGVVARPGEPFENSLRLSFVPIDGLPLLFGTTEVRVGDFSEFVRQNPDFSMPRVSYRQGDEHPVVSVSWDEAVAFCDWLTEREREKGWISESQSYRLPTDAEWSLVAGLVSEVGETPSEKDGLDLRRFPWGDEWPPPRGIVNIDALNLETYFDPHAYTAEVSDLVPNGEGIFGLGGNVSEWCMDEWRPGEGAEKVARGGSWMTSTREGMLSSRRRPLRPDEAPVDVGFRCVLVVE
ncbi:MAG: SUMF1/EgtB/PvdO family nonheme iron enzyme [Verrucomicrobiota bacterium]